MALLAALLVRFRSIIGPLLVAVILAYLFYPLANYFATRLKIPWRLAVSLLYILLVILLVAGLTLSGVALFQQLQSLLGFIDRTLRTLPELASQLSDQFFLFGVFELDFSQLDLQALSEQILAWLQPFLRQLTSLIGVVASSAVRLLGWIAFILMVSYFILAESEGIPARMVFVEVPGYNADIQRLGRELGRIWNAFLRGQVLLTLITILPYWLIMTVLGVRFALSLALLAGLARFIPYVGPLVTYTVTAMVALFQGSTAFGLSPWAYVGIVLLSAVIADQIFDNLVSPRLLGKALGVHPAGILIAAIIAANLLGLVGLLLAAPGLATVKLFGTYAFRKMLDLDPWPEEEIEPPPPTPSFLLRSVQAIRSWVAHNVTRSRRAE
jgi:predicted PurR-regulated permease PerM